MHLARFDRNEMMVEPAGIEPTTYGLQNRCSPAELRPRGPDRTRTDHLDVANVALSQMSYRPGYTQNAKLSITRCGGPCRCRTGYLCDAITALSQLS